MEKQQTTGALELSFIFCMEIAIIIRLCGFPPFYAESNKDLFEMIKKGEFDFPSPHWDPISDLGKDLIKRILAIDPAKRLDGDAILAHPWIVGEKTPRKSLPKVTEKIREFNAKRKFRVYFLVYWEQKLAMVAIAAKKIEILVKERKEKAKK